MAGTAIAPTVTALKQYKDNAVVVAWTPATTTNDTGAAFEAAGFHIQSVQFTGTFGGATALLEGSNDGTNYSTLSNQAGTAISHTSAAIKAVAELTRCVRFKITGGDGTTSLTATLLAKRIS